MERALGVDPAHVRLGVSLGGGEPGIGMSDMMTAVNEFMSRFLNIMRLLIVVVPVVHQSCYMHTVDLGTWLFRLGGVGGFVGVLCMGLVPEQFFNGMALRQYRWAFEIFHPEAVSWSGGVVAAGRGLEALAPAPVFVRRSTANSLDGARVRIRWHGTSGKYLGITNEGWAATGDDTFAVPLVLERVTGKGGEKVTDTYKLRVDDPLARCDGAYLSFSSMNQLRTGGWLGAYGGEQGAGPYKVVIDSSCPPGTCKLLCAWPQLASVTQRYCTGFYLTEQLSGGQPYVGHGPDRDAALLELVPEPAPPVATAPSAAAVAAAAKAK